MRKMKREQFLISYNKRTGIQFLDSLFKQATFQLCKEKERIFNSMQLNYQTHCHAVL